MSKLLLHTCCGPCFLGVWEDLKTKDFEVTNYYYNPNIQPEDEFDLRLDNLKNAAKGKSEGVIVEAYDSNEHLEVIKGQENDFPQRCANCYSLRLERAAKYAKENGFDAFSTTLFVSPYQQHDTLKKLAKEVGVHYRVDFYYVDWRPFFRGGQNEAKDLGIYRQKYCGCTFSYKEANI